MNRITGRFLDPLKMAESITDSRIYGFTEIKTEQKRYKNMDKENKLILYNHSPWLPCTVNHVLND